MDALFSKKTTASPEIISAKIKVNDIEMYYELHGSGKPLVLIAGFSCDHTFWTGVVSELSQHYQVLVFDNRGIGQTDSPDSPYSIDMMADDVMSLIHLLKIKNPTIVGQSMGSAIAQTMAKRFPNEINKIILINTFYKTSQIAKMTFELIGELHKINLPLKYRVQLVAPWVFSNEFLSQPNQLDNLIKLAENNPYPQTWVGYERQLEALKNFDSRTWLPNVAVSTLVMTGAEDILTPPAGAQEIINQVPSVTKSVTVPGGHASPVEQPNKVLQAIMEFVG